MVRLGHATPRRYRLDDYADGWRIEAPDGTVVATRPLAHPHVDEQPFTRSLRGMVLPTDPNGLRIRTSTSPEGWAAETAPLTVTD